MNTLGCFVNIVCESTPLGSPWRLKIDEKFFLKDLRRPYGIILSFSPLLDGPPSCWGLMYLMYCTYGFDHFQFYCFVRILLEVGILYYFTVGQIFLTLMTQVQQTHKTNKTPKDIIPTEQAHSTTPVRQA